MKILFCILTLLSLVVGFFMTVISYFADGLGLYSTAFGDVIYTLAMISLFVSIVCAVLGIIKLRKGSVKKAVLFVLVGVAYSVILIAGMFIDSAVGVVRMEKNIAERNEQTYGEDWNAAPNIEGLPELYQELLNKFYVAVKNEWPADKLMDLSVMGMAGYYGDAALENIGFALMDVDGDGSEEMIIGTTAPVEEGGTAIFCMYSDPENPFANLSGVEGQIYYFHSGEANAYVAEISGADSAWLLEDEADSNLVEIIYQESALDPADRLTLELIPFSRYK